MRRKYALNRDNAAFATSCESFSALEFGRGGGIPAVSQQARGPKKSLIPYRALSTGRTILVFAEKFSGEADTA
jgi:hypothetical protein